MPLSEETLREQEWKAFAEWKKGKVLTLQEEADLFNECFNSMEENENESFNPYLLVPNPDRYWKSL